MLGVLGVLAALAFVLPNAHENTWIFRDGRFYVNVTDTLVEDLSLDQHRFASSWYSGTLGWNRNLDPGWSNVALGRNGEYFPKHPWLLPLFGSPLYFAFGLRATLIFNLLMFGFIAAGLYRFARAYSDPVSSALAVGTFVFGTIIVGSAYDYSVDVFMLACVSQGLAAVVTRRGALAGALFACAVIVKPTALMLVPSLALLTFAPTRDQLARATERATAALSLRRSLVTGSIGLGAFALINTVMYGRPWWSGYNRTLVTVDGAPTLASHADAFGVPFEQGFRQVMFGDYGLSHTFTAALVAVPGLVCLAYRRPRVFLAAAIAVPLSVLVFSKYVYEGHRFHWPAFALLVPAIAATYDLVGRAARRAMPESDGASARVGAAVAAILASSFAVGEPFPRVRGLSYGGPLLEALSSRFEGREAAIVALVFIALVLGASVTALVAVARERGVPILFLAAMTCFLGVNEIRTALVQWVPALALVAALALASAAFLRGRSRRRRVATTLFALPLAAAGLWLLPEAQSVALVPMLSSFVEVPEGAHRLVLVALGVGAVAVLTSGVGLVIDGAPRRTPRRATTWVGVAAALVVLVLAPRFDPGAASFHAAALASVVALLAVLPLLRGFVLRVRESALSLDRRALLTIIAGALVALFVIGVGRRVVHARAPFVLESDEAVRTAVVHQGEVPCDFLAWEHMSWECSQYDRGLYGMAGLALSDPPRFDGVATRALLVPSGPMGQARRVTWQTARAGRSLRLAYGVPDGQLGGGTLIVRIDGVTRAQLEMPPRASPLAFETIDTHELVGRHVELELELVGARGQAVTAVRGTWR